MKEQEQDDVIKFPFGLKPKDRLFLDMAVSDDDAEEASRLVKEYSVEIPDGLTPISFCKHWLSGLRKAEKNHCENVIDLQSQGKSIGGMQAFAAELKKEV